MQLCSKPIQCWDVFHRGTAVSSVQSVKQTGCVHTTGVQQLLLYIYTSSILQYLQVSDPAACIAAAAELFQTVWNWSSLAKSSPPRRREISTRRSVSSSVWFANFVAWWHVIRNSTLFSLLLRDLHTYLTLLSSGLVVIACFMFIQFNAFVSHYRAYCVFAIAFVCCHRHHSDNCMRRLQTP